MLRCVSRKDKLVTLNPASAWMPVLVLYAMKMEVRLKKIKTLLSIMSRPPNTRSSYGYQKLCQGVCSRKLVHKLLWFRLKDRLNDFIVYFQVTATTFLGQRSNLRSIGKRYPKTRRFLVDATSSGSQQTSIIRCTAKSIRFFIEGSSCKNEK